MRSLSREISSSLRRSTNEILGGDQKMDGEKCVVSKVNELNIH
jgi:hypothetical protein